MCLQPPQGSVAEATDDTIVDVLTKCESTLVEIITKVEKAAEEEGVGEEATPRAAAPLTSSLGSTGGFGGVGTGSHGVSEVDVGNARAFNTRITVGDDATSLDGNGSEEEVCVPPSPCHTACERACVCAGGDARWGRRVVFGPSGGEEQGADECGAEQEGSREKEGVNAAIERTAHTHTRTLDHTLSFVSPKSPPTPWGSRAPMTAAYTYSYVTNVMAQEGTVRTCGGTQGNQPAGKVACK